VGQFDAATLIYAFFSVSGEYYLMTWRHHRALHCILWKYGQVWSHYSWLV